MSTLRLALTCLLGALYVLQQVFNGTHTVTHPNSNGLLSATVYGWSRYGGYSYTAGSSVQEIISLSSDGESVSIVTVYVKCVVFNIYNSLLSI